MTDEKVETPSEVANLKMELQRQVAFWQQSSKEWKQGYERQIEHSGQLRAELEATRKTRTEQFFQIGQLEAELERVKGERAAVLNVKSVDGLTSSEWLLRTALAEQRATTAERAAREAYAALYDVCATIRQFVPHDAIALKNVVAMAMSKAAVIERAKERK